MQLRLPFDIASLFEPHRNRERSTDHFLRGIKHCSSSFFSFFHRPLQTLLRAPLYFLPASFPFLLAAEECWFGFGMSGVSETVRVGSNMPEIAEGKQEEEGKEGREGGRGLREMRHVLLAQTALGAGGPETEKRASGTFAL